MRSVVITGAARGLGQALHTWYLERGWHVLPVVRASADAQRLREQCPRRCHPVVADISQDASVARMAAELSEYTGAIHLLINNAGNTASRYTVEEVDTGEVIHALQVHCAGAIRCIQAALPGLRAARGAKIVNITSRMGSLSRNASGEFAREPTSYAYRLAKAAQNMLTVCLGQDPTMQGIAIYGVHPGRIATEIGADDAELQPPAAAARLACWIERADASMSGRCFDLDRGGALPW